MRRKRVKKTQWLGALLFVSLGATAINAIAQTKQVVHKKKTHHHRITERDITECTKLVDRVAARQNKMTIMPVQNKALDAVGSNKMVDTHFKTSAAEAQLFAADNAIPISHLPAAQANKIPAIKAPTVPLATLATPPSFKPTTATLVTASPVRHVIPAHTNKEPLIINNPITNKIPVSIKDPHSSIELSSSPKKLDLDHLQGKSASLAEIAKSKVIDKPTTAPKNKKVDKAAALTSEKKKT
jgi:hypothetical protein